MLAVCHAVAEPGPASTAVDGDIGETIVHVETYTPPERTEMRMPEYPSRALSRGMEGYVVVNLMVAPDGSPYEITVSESSNRIFERAAIRSVEGSEFTPAMMGDDAIDAGLVHMLTFSLSDSPRPRREFANRYKAVLASVAADDRARAGKDVERLQQMDITNNKEHAMLHLGLYQFYLKWGDSRQRLEALKGVTSRLNSSFLNPDVLRRSLLAKFSLQTELKDFGGALKTYELIKAEDMDPAVADRLAATVASIQELKTDDRACSVEGEIPKHYSWFFSLFKNTFQITDVVGDIAEIKLRCERKYVSFRFDPDLEYSVSDEAGACGLELLGDPETTFKFVQL